MKFLDSLRDYDKDNIPPAIINKIREKYISNKEFNPSIIKNVSSACEGLCKWVKAIDVYDGVIKVSKTRIILQFVLYTQHISLLKKTAITIFFVFKCIFR